MKKIVLSILTLVGVLGLTACGDLCVGTECYTDQNDSLECEEGLVPNEEGTECVDESGVTGLDNIIPYVHVNGEGKETDRLAYIMYEFKAVEFIRYQIAYISCTCRPDVNNYWQVAFIEINRYSNDIRYISFAEDGEDGHYTAGMWGDSSPTPEGKLYSDFKNDFFPWLLGKTYDDLDGISVFTNESYHDKITNTKTIEEQDLIDSFAGSSVSTNNMIRVFKELLLYHTDKYDE